MHSRKEQYVYVKVKSVFGSSRVQLLGAVPLPVALLHVESLLAFSVHGAPRWRTGRNFVASWRQGALLGGSGACGAAVLYDRWRSYAPLGVLRLAVANRSNDGFSLAYLERR